ncbi:tRNA pseudouridine(13) synthase TruD [Helicobacter saguini]|uniref:tRNA pseudouridine synthase D n=1 Tax=Helicobacter saguini TaxID=1548018 RepID=A0A347VKH6_9HELI|nr:tRNA pseudouridine(13) synthase TruD [Helicobacter saguini]MWV61143.1 tRNA pseudouridine(13) synthase TruD [Helicobacter saguini]MWV68188.1 tRNA pseudouridine(13) synthase TruD [Helicobacter saguini]MWV70348.1 tRNA pseudouridine(13) synthase TruD [Helicobacter saguini]MWV72250.1 tRNA pseudouridine(13) synthase TruD [Helicobacter saguini]TLD95295.1 tRNA pseudouridine(13) synthase TruD [Helicobacter saguini]
MEKDSINFSPFRMQHNYFQGKSYPPLRFVFSHNCRDFVVEEVPLYEFSGNGEHIILKIRKKNLSTHELLSVLSSVLNIKNRDIGYAGLKDKNALSFQYISLPKVAFFRTIQSNDELEKLLNLKLLDNKNSQNCSIKIIESNLHNNKIKIGHLKGNKFFIRLKKVDSLNFTRLSQEFDKAKSYGFPNFFGYQRFGNFGDNFVNALKIKKPFKKQNPREKLLISSLQSFFFNAWLESRLKISHIISEFSLQDCKKVLQTSFNLGLDSKVLRLLKETNLGLMPLNGDVVMHYPFGKLFFLNIESSSDLERLKSGEVAITGLLSGINCGKNLDSKKFLKSIETSANLDSKKVIESVTFSNLKESENIIESKLDSKAPKVWLARDLAGQIEQDFSYNLEALGSRRYAWVYPTHTHIEYDKVQNHALLSFTLPSGAYATTFLTYLKNGNLFEF